MVPASPRWSASLARRLVLGAGLGLAVGSLGSSAGCQPKTAEAYNEALAERLCNVRRNCPELDLRADYGTVTFPDDNTCESAVALQFDNCDGACEYKPAAGRKCLRRLEKMAESCDARLLGPCRRAYRSCNDTDEDSRCNLTNCSSRVGAPNEEGLPWLVLLAIGFAARRRRR